MTEEPCGVPFYGVAQGRTQLYWLSSSSSKRCFWDSSLLCVSVVVPFLLLSSVLAWRIPGMGEPGGLPSMGSHRVEHDWNDLAAAAAVFHHMTMYIELMHICFLSFMYLFLTVLGLCWCTWAFPSCGKQGPLSSCGAQASHWDGFSCRGARTLGCRPSVVVALGLSSCGSWALEHRLSCSMACGIFPDQRSNWCLPHCQVDSLPLDHQGSPIHAYLNWMVLVFKMLYVLMW